MSTHTAVMFEEFQGDLNWSHHDADIRQSLRQLYTIVVVFSSVRRNKCDSKTICNLTFQSHEPRHNHWQTKSLPLKLCTQVTLNLETWDCTDESRKDETCLQLKMKKHYIKTSKISSEHNYMIIWLRRSTWFWWNNCFLNGFDTKHSNVIII